MAKNLIGGTTTVINESGNDISIDLNQDYTNIIDVNQSMNTTATSLPKAINELLDDIYYKSGDTFSSTVWSSGYFTTGTKEMWSYVYVPKSLKNISSVSITGGSFVIRTTNGNYADGNSSGIGYNATNYSTTVSKINDHLITVVLSKTSAFSNATNNSPCAVVISGLSLSFS